RRGSRHAPDNGRRATATGGRHLPQRLHAELRSGGQRSAHRTLVIAVESLHAGGMSDRTADTDRHGYTLNDEVMTNARRIEPSLSQGNPSTPERCPTLAAAARVYGRRSAIRTSSQIDGRHDLYLRRAPRGAADTPIAAPRSGVGSGGSIPCRNSPHAYVRII